MCVFLSVFFYLQLLQRFTRKFFLSVSKMLSRRELYQERLRVANQRFSSTTDYVKVINY